ncbi:hypothetical protein [Micromonospora sp. NPDC049497]|uniref:hypothetical protein n=1 Tax=Micromonospora sp. NPDC049497 TaxID=3364273 RepID=UPI00379DAC78
MQGLAVGIGSFHFELHSAEAPPIVQVWPERVRRALEAIPSVRDVEIEVPRTYDPASPKDVPGIRYSPHPTSGQIRFRLNIPSRIQKEVFRHWRGTQWENYTVLMFYTPGDPVAFVFVDDAGAETSAAFAVALVRNFIEREMKRLGEASEGVHFVCRGPSPFHVDLSFQPEHGTWDGDKAFERVGMVVEKRQSPGYPEMTVRFDATRFGGANKAAVTFASLTLEQIGLFYRLVAQGGRRADQAREVRQQVDRLISVHQRAGVKAWFLRVFRSGAWARELGLQVLILTYTFSEERRGAKEAVARLCDDADLPAFRSWLEEELAVDHNDDLENCREIAEMLEPRRLRETNAVLVISVAIVSAVLGALLKGLAG